MKKKYKLTDESIKFNNRTLYRIEALKDFGDVEKGDKGGFIEDEHNLSHDGNSWVYGNGMVCDNGMVCGNGMVYGNAMVCGDAKIENNSDYIVFKNWWSSGRYFTWTRSNNMWTVGCFYGTGEELIKKAYKDSELSGREYERVVKYVEEILKENGKENL